MMNNRELGRGVHIIIHMIGHQPLFNISCNIAKHAFKEAGTSEVPLML